MQRSAPLAGLAAVAVSLVFTPQDEGERDAEAVLDELIERTSSIESYRVVYETTGEGEEEASLTVNHVWPNKAHVRFAGGDKVFDIALVDGVMFGESPEGLTYVDFRPSFEAVGRIQSSLSDTFPGAGSSQQGTPGAKVSLFVVDHDHGHESSGNFNLAWVTNLRSPLPWLVDMKRYAEYELEDGLIHCRPKESEEVWIDVESGFPSRLESRKDEGPRILELVELELDPEVSDELFDASGFEAGTIPEDELRRLALSFVVPQRDRLYRALCDHFDSEPKAWDDDDVSSVFETLHEVRLEIGYAPYLADMREWVANFGEWLSVASSERPSEEVDKGMESFREQLEESISAIVLRDLERLEEAEPRLAEATPTEYLEEMQALELEAAGAVYQRVITDPLLEELERVIEENRQD